MKVRFLRAFLFAFWQKQCKNFTLALPINADFTLVLPIGVGFTQVMPIDAENKLIFTHKTVDKISVL